MDVNLGVDINRGLYKWLKPSIAQCTELQINKEFNKLGRSSITKEDYGKYGWYYYHIHLNELNLYLSNVSL